VRKAASGKDLFAFDGAVFFIDWHDVQQAFNVNVSAVTSPLGLERGASFSWNDLDADVVSAGNRALRLVSRRSLDARPRSRRST
jgi:hypothetical protein